MVSVIQNHEGVADNHLRKLLAIAVKSIQWSYAVFWSIPTNQQGLLEWSEGYYNGEIKTRRTMQQMELNAANLGLKRSEQLKDLYESLAAGDTDSQTAKSSEALSPDDLTDAEWYYLVCMSFTFARGEGLPGRALETGQHIWLYNAPYADTKVFSRSLLAKSASIQTVVCFPFLGGVIEFGVTELVSEDLNLLQHVKTVFLEFPKPTSCANFSSTAKSSDNDEGPVCNELKYDGGNIVGIEEPQVFMDSIFPYFSNDQSEFDQGEGHESHIHIYQEFKADSRNVLSNLCDPNHEVKDSFMMVTQNGGASQVQSWDIVDDDLANCVHDSTDSSDCLSQSFFTPENTETSLNRENINLSSFKDLQEFNNKLTSMELDIQELHYTRTLSAIFKKTDQLIGLPGCRTGDTKSGFIGWKKVALADNNLQPVAAHQKMLKKILFEVAYMHSGTQSKSQKQYAGGKKGEVNDDVCSFLFGKSKDKLNDQFAFLRSLVPSVGKFDKESILGDTLEYLKELEKKGDELESCRELTREFEAREMKKLPDIAERTFDNYGIRLVINKRKACNFDEIDPDVNWDLPENVVRTDVSVQMVNNEVFIDLFCPWRECLLIEIMDVLVSLRLDAHSVQSSTDHGILTLKLKSKFKGINVVSEESVKQSLERVVAGH